MALLCFSYADSLYFSDLAGEYDYFSTYVDILKELHCVDGFPDATYRPNVEFTRAEFIKMLVNVNNLQNELTEVTNPPYPDVATNHWAAEYIQLAKNRGWLDFLVDDSNTIQPEKSINNAEAIYMVLACLGYINDNEFSESNYPREGMLKAVELELIDNMTDYTPDHLLLRGNLAILMYNALKTPIFDGVNNDILLINEAFDFEYFLADNLFIENIEFTDPEDSVVEIRFTDKNNNEGYSANGTINDLKNYFYGVNVTTLIKNDTHGENICYLKNNYELVQGFVENITSSSITINGTIYSLGLGNPEYTEIGQYVLAQVDGDEIISFCGLSTIKELPSESGFIDVHSNLDAEIPINSYCIVDGVVTPHDDIECDSVYTEMNEWYYEVSTKHDLRIFNGIGYKEIYGVELPYIKLDNEEIILPSIATLYDSQDDLLIYDSQNGLLIDDDLYNSYIHRTAEVYYNYLGFPSRIIFNEVQDVEGIYVVTSDGITFDEDYHNEGVRLNGILEECEESWAEEFIHRDFYTYLENCDIPESIQSYHFGSNDVMIVWARINDGVIQEIKELDNNLNVTVSKYEGDLTVKELQEYPVDGSTLKCKDNSVINMTTRALVENVIVDVGLNYLEVDEIRTKLTDCDYLSPNGVRFSEEDRFYPKSYVIIDQNDNPVFVYRTVQEIEVNGLYVISSDSVECVNNAGVDEYHVGLNGIFEDCQEQWSSSYVAYDDYVFAPECSIPESIVNYENTLYKSPLFVWARIRDGVIYEIKELEDGLNVDISGYGAGYTIGEIDASNPLEGSTLNLTNGNTAELLGIRNLVYNVYSDKNLVTRTIENVRTELTDCFYSNGSNSRPFSNSTRFDSKSYVVLDKNNIPNIILRTELNDEIEGFYFVLSSVYESQDESGETIWYVELNGLLEECDQEWANEYLSKDRYFFYDSDLIDMDFKEYYIGDYTTNTMYIWAKIRGNEIKEAKVLENGLDVSASSYGENLHVKKIKKGYSINNSIITFDDNSTAQINASYLIGDVIVDRGIKQDYIQEIDYNTIVGNRNTYNSGDYFEENSFAIVDNNNNICFMYREHDTGDIFGLYVVVSKSLTNMDGVYHVDLDGALEKVDEEWSNKFVDRNDYIFANGCVIPQNILEYNMNNSTKPLLVWAHIKNGEILEISEFEDGAKVGVSIYGIEKNYLREISSGYPVSGEIIVDKNDEEHSIRVGHVVLTINVTKDENGKIVDITDECNLYGGNLKLTKDDYFGEGSFIYTETGIPTYNSIATFVFRVVDGVDQTQLGDLDGNGKIEILDVRLLLQAYINSTTSTVWTDEQLALMDMNDDAKVDILDVRLLLQAYINS